MPSSDKPPFTSAQIAEEAKKLFGDQVKPVNVTLNADIVRDVNRFLAQMETSHRDAKNSQLVFK